MPAPEIACARDSLVCGSNDLVRLVFEKGSKGGNVGLNGAVGLDGDKAALGAKALSLCRNDFQMGVIDFGNHHRHVGGPAVGRVVGDYGQLCFGYCFFTSSSSSASP